LADAAEPFAIVDTSPLILLHHIQRLDLLRLAGRIVVPRAVLEEVAAKDPDRRLSRDVAALPWVEEVAAGELTPAISRWSLGKGESAVLQIALDRSAVGILDDKRARSCAASLAIPVIGTVGLIVRARRMGLVSAVRPVLDQLASAGMFLSDKTRAEILRLLGE
jgi:predicted nucleic acid-binding protein